MVSSNITYSLGLVDVVEFFCALAIFSSSRVEDKIRCNRIYIMMIVFFEFFDMNENNYLEEVELQFMFTSSINAIGKLFSFTDDTAKEQAQE